MRLVVISDSYDSFVVEAEKQWSIDVLKTKAVSHFISVQDASKQSVYFKMILVKSSTVLCDTKSIQEQYICTNGKCLFTCLQ